MRHLNIQHLIRDEVHPRAWRTTQNYETLRKLVYSTTIHAEEPQDWVYRWSKFRGKPSIFR